MATRLQVEKETLEKDRERWDEITKELGIVKPLVEGLRISADEFPYGLGAVGYENLRSKQSYLVGQGEERTDLVSEKLWFVREILDLTDEQIELSLKGLWEIKDDNY